jgi:hypothetical protein
MSGYVLGWTIMVLSTAAMAGSVWGLYRYTGFREALKLILPGLFILLVIPAPVPDYPEFLAPAFLVAIFEWAFQDNGKPWVALRMLGIGLVVAAMAGAGVWLALRMLRQRRKSA